MNNPIFQGDLFKLEKDEQVSLIGALRKINQLTWNELYKDQGLKWELILSKTSKYEAGEHQVIINGNSLPEGAYIYRVEIGDEETFSHRFIKIR